MRHGDPLFERGLDLGERSCMPRERIEYRLTTKFILTRWEGFLLTSSSLMCCYLGAEEVLQVPNDSVLSTHTSDFAVRGGG